ncbi:glycerophosphodiester phosphodiesterase family protein [Acinetobacter puyangensis]|uniref:glycerophosphodiester phosphodiesterase family protein n=1 Tax=Acinetobacter puyangensis TaxID=1096779 RepID=UPI003A4DD276
MKISALALSILLAFSLSGCGSDDHSDTPPEVETPENPDDGSVTEPLPEAKVLYEVNFAEQNSLPAGWTTVSANTGSVAVQDGHLYIDGRKHDTNMTTVMLPEATQNYTDYRVDVEFTFENPNNSGRWGSVVYRATGTASNPEPYYQFAIRSNATASNGTEFALRQDSKWNVQSSKAFTEAIDPQKVYKATVIVHGNRVRQYLNEQLMEDVELPSDQIKGAIGLSTAGLVMKVNSIKVTEQWESLPNINSSATDVQESGTYASLAPTIIQKVQTANDSLPNASQVFYQLDKSLNLNDLNGKKVTTLKEYLADSTHRTIPVLQINDEATLASLKNISQSIDLEDITLSSSNPDLLRTTHRLLPAIRTALDLRSTTLGNSRAELLSIARQTNQAAARIVILPASLATKENLSFIQKLLVTVWVDSSAATVSDAANIIVSGANGIMASNSDVFNSVLRQLPRYTLLRKPLIVAHRGVPSLEDENTLEGLKESVRLGADAVENDIYITTDNHLVIMHDDTVDRTTTGQGKIEEMSLAQVKQLVTKPKGYKIPTLGEFFVELKNNKDVMHFVELKSSNEKIVAQLKKEIEEYGVDDQIVTISFIPDQINRMKTILSGVSTGFLTNAPNSGNVLKDARTVMQSSQSYTSTFNPSYGNVTSALMEALKHRGITFWPWTVNDETVFKKLYVAGTYGLTTNYAQYASKYVVDLKTAATASAKVGQALNINAQLTTQDGVKSNANANQFVILAGAPSYTVNGRNLTFKAKGTAYVLPGYRYDIDSTYNYSIFSTLVKVTVE